MLSKEGSNLLLDMVVLCIMVAPDFVKVEVVEIGERIRAKYARYVQDVILPLLLA